MNTFEKFFSDNIKKVKDLGINFNEPASTNDIKEFESKLSRKLPLELINFYTFCNGFETDDLLFRVIPISECIDYKDELELNTFHFAEYMIYSDAWLIQLNQLDEYAIINDNHKSQELAIQANSIINFFELYLNGGLFPKENLDFWSRLKEV